MKVFNRETLREKLLEEKVKELEGIIQRKEEKAKKEEHKEALIYLKGVCEGYKQRQQENNIERFYR